MARSIAESIVVYTRQSFRIFVSLAVEITEEDETDDDVIAQSEQEDHNKFSLPYGKHSESCDTYCVYCVHVPSYCRSLAMLTQRTHMLYLTEPCDVGDVKITFLPLGSSQDLWKKAKYQKLFNLVYISNR